ncbi:surface-adhesin E family protein [Luteimonas sp. MJ250]|uniref:surface-adhesin E family protein n=1 Tax=Luteimonas sp. MJ250 TaxID=3129236 RepID=UPI0031B9DD59
MKFHLLIPALICVALPSTAFSQSWVRLATAPSSTVFYYDADSVKPNEDRTAVSILTMADHRNDASISKDFTEVLFKVNCQNLNVSQIHTYKYNAGPKDEERNYVNPYDRIYYAPERGSIEDRVLDVACAL